MKKSELRNIIREIIKENLLELNLIDFYDFWLCEEIGFDKENI